MATTKTMPDLPVYSEHASQHDNNNNNNHTQQSSTTEAQDTAHLDFDDGDGLPPYPNTPPRSRSTSPSLTTRKPLPSIVQEKAALAALYDSHNKNNKDCHHRSTIDLSSPSPASAFNPTSQLHIQHAGKPWLSLPLPQRPDPIPIIAVDNVTGQVLQGSEAVVYVSVRPERRSGSCFLVSGGGGGSGGSAAAAGRRLTSTTYRFGPGNPPVVSLGLAAAVAGNDGDDDEGRMGSTYNDNHCPGSHHHQRQQQSQGRNEEGEEKQPSFQVRSKGLATRAVEFETGCFLLPPSPSSQLSTTTTRRGGVQRDKFTWRYAGSRERAALVPCISGGGGGDPSKSGANSLLVLERTTTTGSNNTGAVVAGGDGKYDSGAGSSGAGSKTEVYTTTAAPVEEEGTLKGVSMLGRLAAWRTRTDPLEHSRNENKPSSSGDSSSDSVNSSTQTIAMLVRSDDLRSPGSSASAAGNGGRLLLDLRSFAADDKLEEEDDDDRKKRVDGGGIGADGIPGRREELARQMVVTTALVMLKREVDRRRAAQIAIMGSGGV